MMKNRPFRHRQPGFTLAELLIALGILGVIATFTIPKLLQTQQKSEYKAGAREAMGMISGAYQQYVQENGVSGSLMPSDLTPYMNYVSIRTTGSVDDLYGYATMGCSGGAGGEPCVMLHNGSALRLMNCGFGGSTPNRLMEFLYDPDGQVTDGGAVNSGGKSIRLFLYYNGRLTTGGGLISGGGAASSCWAWNSPWPDPPWYTNG